MQVTITMNARGERHVVAGQHVQVSARRSDGETVRVIVDGRLYVAASVVLREGD